MVRRSGQGKRGKIASGKGVQESQGAKPRTGVGNSFRTQFSQLRNWFMDEKIYLFILLGIFILALVLRTIQYYQVGFEDWPPSLSGNDPYYHKRIIDDIQTNHRHLITDPMLNYPLSGGNPRPPFYDWSIAILGLIIGNTLGLFIPGLDTTRVTWYIIAFSPSVYGALSVFPVYMIGKETFNRKAGLMAAAALCLMPSFIERSSLGFADHDAAVVFFLVLSFFFLMRANRHYRDENWVKDWRKPGDWILGLRKFFVESRLAVGYNLLAGIALGTIAVTWGGFPYIFAILLIYFAVQILINRLRNLDMMSVFFSVFITLATALVMSFPYYSQVSIAAWITPLYILLAVLLLGVALVPTRDLPWIIVIPSMVVLGAVSYFILDQMFPETANLLFSGGGYFVTNKLYSTIAEAQAPELSRMITSLGVAVFFLALVGVVWAGIIIPKKMKKDYMLIVIWSGVAIFMTLSAARFQFNATPVFALLAAWILFLLIEKFDSESWAPLSILDIPWRTKWFWTALVCAEALIVFITVMVVANNEWNNWFVRHMEIIMLSVILSTHLGGFIILRYIFKKEKFNVMTILTALFVGFIVLMPNLFLAFDASIPYEEKSEIDPTGDYTGSFAQSFTSDYWVDGFEFIESQDRDVPMEERPGWISWWDYGFWCVYIGQHPTAADNFQNGYQFAGSYIAAQSEEEAIALQAVRLAEGNWVNHGGKFNQSMKELLIEYLDEGDMDDHPNYDQFNKYMSRPADFIEEVEDNPEKYGNYIDLKNLNARYATCRVLLTDLLEKEELVDLTTAEEQLTNKALRYFGVDSRLFPFEASNTGIFYAPIKLADKDIRDYLEYWAYAQKNLGTNDEPEWVDYNDNPLSPERVEEEAERLKYKFRIKRYELKYTESFYNSMFYKCYIGYGGDDIGIPSNDGIPSMMGNLQSYPAMQGWNMSHYRLVYKTMYYSDKDADNATFPDDYEAMNYVDAVALYEEEGGDLKSGLGQGVFILEYFPGAVQKGIVRTHNGTPVPDARITVFDEYGIPHDSVVTNETGEYSVILPFGDIKIVTTTGDLAEPYDYINQFKTSGQQGVPDTLLNISAMHVTKEKANRKIDHIVNEDIYVDAGKVYGTIYWDNDNDAQFTEGIDVPIEYSNVTLNHKSGLKIYSNTQMSSSSFEYDTVIDTGVESGLQYVDSVSDGALYFDDLVVGDYDIEIIVDDHVLPLGEGVTIKPGDRTQKDLAVAPGTISGYTVYNNGGNGTAEGGHVVKVFDPVSTRLWTNITDADGKFQFEGLLPGEYLLLLEEEDFERQFATIVVDFGARIESNITLVPITFGSGTINLRGIDPSTRSDPVLENVYVLFENLQNVTWSRTAFTVADGKYSVRLIPGDYRVYSKFTSNEKIMVHMGSVTVTNESSFVYDMTLEPAVKVMGNMTKAANREVFDADIIFESMNNGETARVQTNRTGEYYIYLPRDDYFVNVYHETDIGGNFLIHQGSIMKDDMVPTMTYNMFVDKGIAVRGTVFWDKNLNGQLDIYLSDSPLGDAPGGINDSLVNAGVPGPSDMHINTKEGVEGVAVELISELGRARTYTDYNGSFTIFAQADRNYTLRLVDNDYMISEREIYVSTDIEVENFGLNDQNLTAIPINATITFEGYVDLDYDHEMDADESVDGYEFHLISKNTYTDDVILKFNASSKAAVRVLPGLYAVRMLHEEVENGRDVSYVFDKELIVQMGTTALTLEMNIIKYVESSGDFGYYLPEYIGGPLVYQNPANATITFRPMFEYETIYEEYELYMETNGSMTFSLPYGEYSVSSELLDPIDHSFMTLFFNDVDNDLAGTLYKEAVTLSGKTLVDGEETGISVPIVIRDVETNAERSTAPHLGAYELQLVPGRTYEVIVNEETQEDGKTVRYLYNHEILLTDDTALDVDILKLLNIKGVVFYDYGHDGGYDPYEGIVNSTVTFSTDADVPDEYTTVDYFINTTEGSFDLFLPLVEYTIVVDYAGFSSVPIQNHKIIVELDLPGELNVELQSSNLTVSGHTYFDVNGDLEVDMDVDRAIPSTTMSFIAKSAHAQSNEVVSGPDGQFSVDLLPGQYYVYAYQVEDPEDEYAFLGLIEVILGEDRYLNLSMNTADRILGTVSYTDTNGTFTDDLTKLDGIEVTYIDTKLYFDIIGGKYGIKEIVCLPEGDHSFSVIHKQNEFDMQMTYRADLDLNVSRTHEESNVYNLLLHKIRDYSVTLEFYDEDDFKRTIAPPGPESYKVWVTNQGNEPQVVQFSDVHLPTDWSVDYAQQNVTLEIGDRVLTSFALTTNDNPKADNENIEIQVTSLNSTTTDSVVFSVKTPPKHAFEFYTDGDKDNGVDFNSVSEYNVTLENLGNIGDRFEITMTMETNVDDPDQWNATMYLAGGYDRDDPLNQLYMDGDPKEVSLLPFETRNYTLEIQAPNSSDAYFSDAVTFHITCKPLFTTQVGSKTFNFTLQIRKPNLKIEEVKYRNMRLDGKSNRTLWIDVGVRAENRECHNVPVKVYIDSTLVTSQGEAPDGNWTIDEVPEDGVAWITIPFDAKLNKTDDGQVHTVKVVVDEDDVFDESKEDDNKLTKSKKIGPDDSEDIPWTWIIFFGTVIVAVGVGLIVWRRRAELI